MKYYNCKKKPVIFRCLNKIEHLKTLTFIKCFEQLHKFIFTNKCRRPLLKIKIIFILAKKIRISK